MTRALAVLFAVNTLNIYDRMLPAALLEPIRREFALSDAQAGFLQTGFVLVYAVAGIPLGRLADRRSRGKLLAAAVALWAGLTAAGGFAASYAVLLICRLGVAIGEAACAPAATSWIGSLFPPERRARALAIFMFGVPLGGALCYGFSGAIGEAWGWRAAMVLAAAPALVLAPALLMIPEPARAPGLEAASPKLRLSRAFLWIIASGAILNFSLYAFATFLPAFMTRVHGLSVAQAGLWVGLGYGIAGIAGGAAGGALGDRRPSYRLAIAALACAASALPAALGVLNSSAAWSLIALLAAYALLSSYYGLVYAAIQDLVPAGAVGSAMAFYFLVMYLCGAAFGPFLTGTLSDMLAARALASGLGAEAARGAGLQQAMLLIPVLSLGVAASLWKACRSAWPDQLQTPAFRR